MEVELSLHDYWRIIRKRQWAATTAFGATFLSTVFYAQLQTPLYRAQALVKFEPPQERLLGSTGVYDPSASLASELRLLDSEDIHDRMAKRLRPPSEKVS